MPSQLYSIAKNTFIESVRQPIYFILVFICGLAQILNTWGSNFSLGYTDSAEVSGDNKLLLDIGLATVFVCGMLLAAFVATAVVSREIENKTVLTVVSKPVSRHTLILGKYLGVAAAMLLATLTMLLFLQMAIRHGVLSNASDPVDQPVIIFTLIASLIAFAVAIWTNFFYGWVFSQVATLLLLPLFTLALLGVMLVNKQWQLQPILTDFKPQIALASGCVALALLVLTAIATAASTRLGQVMTIVVCCGVFLLGLLSNHFIGRRAYSNRFVGVIMDAAPLRAGEASFSEPGDTWNINLKYAPREDLKVGAPFYYGPNPNGFPLSTTSFRPFTGDATDRESLFRSGQSPSLVVTESDGPRLVVRHAGPAGRLTLEEPARGHFVFIRPTRVNIAALGLWGIIPNIQFFWLVDAVSQSQTIPLAHAGLVGIYGLLQIIAAVSIAVLLFQRREVG